jgi:hypothetical protein
VLDQVLVLQPLIQTGADQRVDQALVVQDETVPCPDADVVGRQPARLLVLGFLADTVPTAPQQNGETDLRLGRQKVVSRVPARTVFPQYGRRSGHGRIAVTADGRVFRLPGRRRITPPSAPASPDAADAAGTASTSRTLAPSRKTAVSRSSSPAGRATPCTTRVPSSQFVPQPFPLGTTEPQCLHLLHKG